MRLLHQLRKHATRRHIPELALPLELVRLPDLGQHADRLVPHFAGVPGVNAESHLLVGVGAPGAEFNPAIGELIDHCHALGNSHRMGVRQDRYSKTYPDVLGALAERTEYNLRARRAGESKEEVVLDEPHPVEARPIGQFALVKRLLVQGVPVYVSALVRALHFK